MLPSDIHALWAISPVAAVLTLVDAAAMGAAIGSFLHAQVWRLHTGEHRHYGIWAMLRRAVRCPRCGKPIARRDNIPLVSWLLLRGRCRHCRSPISARYFVFELLGATLTVLAPVFFGISWAALLACFVAWLSVWLLAMASMAGRGRVGRSLTRKDKLAAVRAANRASAAAHKAHHSAKALTLSDELGPFPLFFHDDGHWRVRHVSLRCVKDGSGRYRFSVLSPHTAPVNGAVIPGVEGGQRLEANNGASLYGPYAERGEGYNALRLPMIRWSLRSLLNTIKKSGLSATILSVRLEEELRGDVMAEFANPVVLTVWLKHLSHRIRLDRGPAGALDAIDLLVSMLGAGQRYRRTPHD
jgi:hypothetical protein